MAKNSLPIFFAIAKTQPILSKDRFVFLYWLIQRKELEAYVSHGCDLLSNLYFCIGWYSLGRWQYRDRRVVICFQICIFVLVDTARQGQHAKYQLLWFAFKFVFLYWLIQRCRKGIRSRRSCDLLSNLYFCIGWYSLPTGYNFLQFVVICFQICIFVLVDTAYRNNATYGEQLWFAFKFVFLYWLIQLHQ